MKSNCFKYYCITLLINNVVCAMESNMIEAPNIISIINNDDAPCANQRYQIYNKDIDLQKENNILKTKLQNLQINY